MFITLRVCVTLPQLLWLYCGVCHGVTHYAGSKRGYIRGHIFIFIYITEQGFILLQNRFVMRKFVRSQENPRTVESFQRGVSRVMPKCRCMK